MIKNIFRKALNIFPRPFLIRVSYIIRPLFSFFLRGTNFTDPIDNKSFKYFLPYGYENQRANVLSPSTLSLERHRLLWLYLKNETSLFTTPQKLLHFAPEQAFYKRFKKLKHINYVTTDLVSPLADIKADICNLPFEDNSFDFILCNHVLEHIPNDTKAMQELYRVLKPNGTAILQIPLDYNRAITFEDNSITDAKERAKIFGQYDHVRIYGLDYFDKLKEIGFKVNANHYSQTLTTEEIKRYCLDENELIPICTK